MPRRFVDLSIYLENDVISDPPPFGPKIQYHKHADTAGQIAGFFPGLKKEDLPSTSRPTTARISTRPITSIRR
jgi:hypothetical protein